MNDIIKLAADAYSFPRLVTLLSVAIVIIWKWKNERREREENKNVRCIERLNSILLDSSARKDFFVVEQIFLERYRVLLDYKEIMFFMNRDNPSRLLTNYIKSNRFVQFNESRTGLINGNFINAMTIKIWLWLTIFIGSFLAVIGLVGLLVSIFMILRADNPLFICNVLIISTGAFIIAWFSYEINACMESAERLQHLVTS